jgi:hypothetical protein
MLIPIRTKIRTRSHPRRNNQQVYRNSQNGWRLSTFSSTSWPISINVRCYFINRKGFSECEVLKRNSLPPMGSPSNMQIGGLPYLSAGDSKPSASWQPQPRSSNPPNKPVGNSKIGFVPTIFFPDRK